MDTRFGVYIAARYGRRAEMERLAIRLDVLGFRSTATWLLGLSSYIPGAPGCCPPDQCAKPVVALKAHTIDTLSGYSAQDLLDIRGSNAVLFFAEKDKVYSRGGRHVEMGYALALGLPVVYVGEPENVHAYAQEVVCWAHGVGKAIAALRSLRDRRSHDMA